MFYRTLHLVIYINLAYHDQINRPPSIVYATLPGSLLLLLLIAPPFTAIKVQNPVNC